MIRGRGAKIDANQPAIVIELRRRGASVQSLAEIGRGCVDLLCGFRGNNFLFEIKDPTRKPSERRLTDDETKWFASWLGQVDLIETADEAWAIMVARA